MSDLPPASIVTPGLAAGVWLVLATSVAAAAEPKAAAQPVQASSASSAAPRYPSFASRAQAAEAAPAKAAASTQPAAEAKPKATTKAKTREGAAAPEAVWVKRTASVPASQQDVDALRAEVKALREDLGRAVGTPEDALEAADPDRERLEAELSVEKQKRASIQAAIDAGLDAAAVADSIQRSEARIAELKAAIAALPAPKPAPPRASLEDVASAVARLDARITENAAAAPAQTESETSAQKPTEAATPEAAKPIIDAEAATPKSDLLPIEFTAFGDFFYRFARGEDDAFGIGTVEVDAALRLTPYVLVSTAIAYSPDNGAFELPAFVIDCGLVGKGEGFLVQSDSIVKSGASFGRFDVPFGIAYLEYPSVVNRLVSLPQAVLATHGGWNDLGAQAYVVGEHWSALGYVVNGTEMPVDAETTEPAITAFGGRLAGRQEGVLEVGGSAAGVFARSGPPAVLAGGDVATSIGRLDIHGEYLLKHVDAPGVVANTQGVYARAMVDISPVFALARFDTLIEGKEVVDRRLALGAVIEIFPQGEVRAVYEQSFDSDVRMLTIQLVGGSTFQPTGLRR